MLFVNFKEIERMVCQPHPEYYKDASQRDECYQRNQGQLKLYSGFIFVLLFGTIVININKSTDLSLMIVPVINIFAFLYFCRTRIWIHNFICTITITFAQLFLLHLKNLSAINSLIGAFLTPSLVLMFTENVTCFIFSAFSQVLLLQIPYRRIVEKEIKEVNEEVFCNAIINGTIFLLLLLTGIHCLIHQKSVKSTEKAKQESSQLKLFIQAFSHELRNPLNSMLGNIDLALQEFIPSEIFEMIESAKVSGELLLQLVNNILDTGKLHMGKLEVTPISANIGDVMFKVWRISKDLIKKKKLNGYLKLDKNLPPLLHIDPYRMSQIVLNLLNNAIKFTNKGHIWTTLEWIPNGILSDESFKPLPYDEDGLFEKEQNFKALMRESNDSDYINYVYSKKNDLNGQKLNFNCQKGKGVLKIIIKDSGCGIKREDLSKVFEKYTQVHSDPCQRKVGAGLGLFITKEICERMGGQIRVYSQEGQGAAFIVCIPTHSILSSDEMSSSSTECHKSEKNGGI